MYEPYVQDTAKWVAYYAQSVHANKPANMPDAQTSGAPNAGSLSENGSMSVIRVEPKGPLPPVPHGGSSVALNSVTQSQASLQQAKFNAMRDKINNGQLTGKRGIAGRVSNMKRPSLKAVTKKGRPSKSANGGKSKKQLFGTPQDIFKAASKKTKKGNGKGSKKK